jgi:hypothetical protein
VTLDDVVRHLVATPNHPTTDLRRRGEVVSGIVLTAAYGLDTYLPASPERDAAMRGLVTVHEQSQAAIGHG